MLAASLRLTVGPPGGGPGPGATRAVTVPLAVPLAHTAGSDFNLTSQSLLGLAVAAQSESGGYTLHAGARRSVPVTGSQARRLVMPAAAAAAAAGPVRHVPSSGHGVPVRVQVGMRFTRHRFRFQSVT